MDDDDDLSLKVQKNFICDHCYGAFRSSYHLKRHILTHTGENSQLTAALQCDLPHFSVCDSCSSRSCIRGVVRLLFSQ